MFLEFFKVFLIFCLFSSSLEKLFSQLALSFLNRRFFFHNEEHMYV